MLYRAQYSLFALAGLVLAVSIGCGDGMPYQVVPLEGTITFKGAPLENVLLDFTVEEYRNSGAYVQTGGRFEAIHSPSVRGVPVGTCTLRIGWGGGAENRPPADYEELFSQYGMDTAGYIFEVPNRGDRNFRIDLE
ncbi:MAG: hypothetical protein FWG73_00700 [Planctomycetaceae bacterium]|nr:hypothetical protein [Planctomycetaceae bacterium]